MTLEDAVFATVLFVTIVAGAIVSLYLQRVARTAGVGFGASVSLAAAWVLMGSYFMIDPVVVLLGLALLGIPLVTSAYFLTGRSFRVFLLLGAIWIPLISLGMFSLSLEALFIYTGVLVAVVVAYDFSGINVTACFNRTNRYLGIFIWPFAATQRYFSRLPQVAYPRLFVATLFFILGLGILLVLPFLIREVSGGILRFADSEIVLVILLYFASRECYKELKDPERGMRNQEVGTSNVSCYLDFPRLSTEQ